MKQLVATSILLFPLWIILFSVWAILNPDYWSNFNFLIVPLLSIVMFSMGLTLKINDFIKIFKSFKFLKLGLFLQFLIMPLLGFFLVKFFSVDKMIGVGVILVGCAPGGTASNVICYLAKGDLALSISLTICSTVLSIFMMPLLFWLYTGSNIDVPITQMIISIFQIVILPVSFGILLNTLIFLDLEKIKIFLPLVAVIAIILIVTIIIASNSDQIFTTLHVPIIFILILLEMFLS